MSIHDTAITLYQEYGEEVKFRYKAGTCSLERYTIDLVPTATYIYEECNCGNFVTNNRVETVGDKRMKTSQQGRCITCRHWTRLGESETSGKCGSSKFVYGFSGFPKDSLCYWDHEGYSAGFDTGEDFGCVHWVEK